MIICFCSAAAWRVLCGGGGAGRGGGPPAAAGPGPGGRGARGPLRQGRVG